jgi:hypothetical protein
VYNFGDLLYVPGHEDLLARYRTLGQLDVLGGLRHCVAESEANAGEAEFANSGAIAAIFDDQHALLAGFFVRD